ncbi:hypothetical protein Tco_0397568 [Tanacetum coccineum]
MRKIENKGKVSTEMASTGIYPKGSIMNLEHPSITKVFHNEDGNPARANIKQALGSDHLKMEMEMEIPSSSNVKLITECSDTTYTYEVMKDLIKEVPSFDEPEPQPQPFPRFLSLEVDLGEERDPEPTIKPHSSDSFRMKVIFDEKKLEKILRKFHWTILG